MLMLLYKIINGLTSDYMYDMIQPYTENINDYNLRQQISGDNIRLPFCNTVSYSKGFIPCTLRLWNGLPASMIPVKAPPIILCTALYIIFIGNNLLIPLMNLTYNLLFKPYFMEVKLLVINKH
jgi:hypothetical protein